jgi:hypothetical protein
MLSNLKTNGGNLSPTQRTISIGGLYVFQSYNSIIYVRLPNGSTYLGHDHDYSRTTSRYLKKYLDEYNLKLPTDIRSSSELYDIVLEQINKLK